MRKDPYQFRIPLTLGKSGVRVMRIISNLPTCLRFLFQKCHAWHLCSRGCRSGSHLLLWSVYVRWTLDFLFALSVCLGCKILSKRRVTTCLLLLFLTSLGISSSWDVWELESIPDETKVTKVLTETFLYLFNPTHTATEMPQRPF